jgi:putative membrane protein
VLVLCALALFVYVRRWLGVRRDAGTRRASVGRLLCFCGGIALVLVALVSPLDRLADDLFVMHMTQHVLLLDLVPILAILGLTRVILRPATARMQRLERAVGPVAHPVFAVCLYVAAMWVWHVAALYDGALRHPALHALEHVTFASAGLLYWWHLLSPIRSRHRLRGLGPVAYMVSTKIAVGLLGIFLTFSPTLLYRYYAHKPHYWGMSPTTDQQVGGALMALEQSVVMGIALAVLLFRVLSESEREEQRAERYGSAA